MSYCVWICVAHMFPSLSIFHILTPSSSSLLIVILHVIFSPFIFIYKSANEQFKLRSTYFTIQCVQHAPLPTHKKSTIDGFEYSYVVWIWPWISIVWFVVRERKKYMFGLDCSHFYFGFILFLFAIFRYRSSAYVLDFFLSHVIILYLSSTG